LVRVRRRRNRTSASFPDPRPRAEPQNNNVAPSLVEPAQGRPVGSDGRSSSAIRTAENRRRPVGRMNDVLFNGVVRGQAEKVVEFFLERGTAEVVICKVRSRRAGAYAGVRPRIHSR